MCVWVCGCGGVGVGGCGVGCGVGGVWGVEGGGGGERHTILHKQTEEAYTMLGLEEILA